MHWRAGPDSQNGGVAEGIWKEDREAEIYAGDIRVKIEKFELALKQQTQQPLNALGGYRAIAEAPFLVEQEGVAIIVETEQVHRDELPVPVENSIEQKDPVIADRYQQDSCGYDGEAGPT